MASVNSCAVCGFPIVANGKCLHTIIGYNEKQWREIEIEAGLDEQGESHFIPAAKESAHPPDRFARRVARIFWLFVLAMFFVTVVGVWYKAFWLGWVMQ